MAKYDPSLAGNRLDLAVSVISKLDECGFNRNRNLETGPPNLSEHVWTRDINDNVLVAVYTSCSGHRGYISARNRGSDAIRVVTLYQPSSGKMKGLGKQSRVYRTGDVDSICERMAERMRAAWKIGANPSKCNKCGAPLFTSKRGNLVCAEVCWK